MMKRIFRFSLTFLLLFFVSMTTASAALPQTFNNVLRIIAQPLQVLFVTLPASSAFPYLLKFLYFIILAALWSGIASQITKNSEGGVKRAFKIFGVIVALVSAIFIPQSWLMYAFKLPAMISIVLFFLVVPLAGFFICTKLIPGDSKAARFGRAFIWWVIAMIVLALVEFIQKHPDPALQQLISPVLDALNIGAVIAIFAGLYNLAMAFGAGTAAEAVRDAVTGSTAKTADKENKEGADHKDEKDHKKGVDQKDDKGKTTPPPPDKEQLEQLAKQIENFIRAVQEFDHRLIDPSDDTKGLIRAYDHLHHQVSDPVQKKQVAQQLLPTFQTLAQFITQMQTLMNAILDNPQYPNLDGPNLHIREEFEHAVAGFLNMQTAFSEAHGMTIQFAQ